MFEHISSPTAFYKSILRWRTEGGWELRLQDGTTYYFGDIAPIQSMRDRFDNSIVFTWSNTLSTGQGTGNLLKMTSSSGRFIEFTYDGSNRMTQAKCASESGFIGHQSSAQDT